MYTCDSVNLALCIGILDFLGSENIHDVLFGFSHKHMNKNNQVKSVLYVYILGKGLCERGESFKKFSLCYLHTIQI